MPGYELLDGPLVERVLDEAFALLRGHGVRVTSHPARDLLESAGSDVDGEIVRIPGQVLQGCLQTAPRQFELYGRTG